MLSAPSIADHGAQAESELQAGINALGRGALEAAARSFTDAAASAEHDRAPDRQAVALLYLAQTKVGLGQYREAISALRTALAISQSAPGNAHLVAGALSSLGEIYTVVGPPEMAEQVLRESLAMARASGQELIAAGALNGIASVYYQTGRIPEAIEAYREGETLARQAGNPLLAARIATNAAYALYDAGEPARARRMLDSALSELRSAQPSHETAYGLTAAGVGLRRLLPSFSSERSAILLQGASALSEAGTLSERIGDRRAASYAWGYLALYYQEEAREDDALILTQRAIHRAQQANAPESLFLWQWQAARLLGRTGARKDAIASYRAAVATVQSIRSELAVSSYGPVSGFRERLAPLYLELVDALLLSSDSAGPDEAAVATVLSEARDVVELLKAAELRDYFRDDCVDLARSRATRLETVSSSTAIIYPILLPDRMELLLSAGGTLKRVTVPASADQVTQQVRAFRTRLEKRTTNQFMPHAQQLYRWLIQPLEKELVAANIGTLVFVPDGPLRTIPLAALHDGQQFLISRYALAVTPGLDLTDPRPLDRSHPQVLAAGLTQSVQGFPPLPQVSAEITGLHQLMGGRIMLDRDFATDKLERELKGEKFNIVHLATHGQFDSRADATFVLTFDGKLTLDRLDRLIGLFKYRNEPLELLTLSACDTAGGDDRAALGLAGIAVKAGARSALATLWSVNDDVSAQLVLEFYRQLQSPLVSRAEALRRAQLKILGTPPYEHPGYWSPFLLINNWL
jgi:CHAT domain-containing protein